MNLFKKYVEYLNDNPQKYWFKRKLYGWGWTPANNEGWLVTFAYIVLVIFFASAIDERLLPKEVYFTGLLPILLLTITFIRIAYVKGEKPKWQWGNKDKTMSDVEKK